MAFRTLGRRRPYQRVEVVVPTIKAIEARLDVADVARSARFYVDVLGFAVGTLWPEESAQFAILRRDGVRLPLGRREGGASTLACPSTSTLWLDVEGILGYGET